MEITKEYLENKKTELEQGMQQIMANYNANKGAIQVLDLLISELVKEVEVEVKE